MMANQAPWDPDALEFPCRSDLPVLPGAPKDAAWVWGADDNLGRLNLLTPRRVKEASAEIKTGEMVPLNLPFNVPEQPAFNREKFVHTIKTLAENIAYDDTYHLNTQSSTQWDGFRHFAHLESQTFYNGIKGSDVVGPNANLRGGVHYWAEHGIAGRGVLLDYRAYAKAHGIQYEPYERHAISVEDLRACGKWQGIDIRPQAQGGDIKVGDILMIRSGFVERYHELSPEARNALGLRKHEIGSPDDVSWAGVKQEQAMIDWLHDCYFAAVGGDAPSFERWPSAESYYLHEYVIALWGMPLGEMWDLERLAAKCRQLNRWTFFLTSSPANVPGGIGSHANAIAIL